MASSPPASLPHRAGGQVRNQSVAPRWRAARRRPRSYTQSGVVQIAGTPRLPDLRWRLQGTAAWLAFARFTTAADLAA
jgi:hypothetical protein